jgi:hypothetical protein
LSKKTQGADEENYAIVELIIEEDIKIIQEVDK